MIVAQMTSIQWASVGIIVAFTLLVWVIVIFILLPRWEDRLEGREKEKKIRESRKKARRIRVDSERARLDFNNLVLKEGPGGNDEG
jgi:F0F1-type ATP synthase membrane subunit b/b'